MSLSSVSITYSRPERILGRHDTLILTVREGILSFRMFCSGIVDDFTMPEVKWERDVGKDALRPLEETLPSLRKHSVEGDTSIVLRIADGKKESVLGFNDEPEALASFRRGLCQDSFFDDSESSSLMPILSEEEISKLYSKGTISDRAASAYDARRKRFEARKKQVSQLLDSRRYALERGHEDIMEDHDLGLISDDEYNTFVWYCRNVPELDHVDNTMISVKLKLSVWGLRIGGRFDTFEFFVDKDDEELVDRSYCVHGTLFEGCGNYKAPDAAAHTPLGKERTGMIFDFLQFLEDKNILGQNLSEPRYDCGFFDLYVRYEDRGSVHTKGTTEYPYFIKYLMFLMGAKESL